MSSQQELNKMKKTLDKQMQKQTKEGLAEIYELLGCSGIAKEIKAGRKVTENAEFGFRSCVRSKTAPTVDSKTLKFYPQTKNAMEIEKKFVDKVNTVLENGGFKKMSPSLLSDIRIKDKEFEQQIKKRKKGN